MDNSDWLEFLDRIAIDKKLTTIQKTTLKAKFPTFNGMVNDRDLLVSLNLETPTTLKKRLGVLYKIFGLLKDLDNKAIALQKYLQQESLKYQCEKEQDSIDTPPTFTPPPKTSQRRLFGETKIKSIPKWVGRDELLTELCNELENHKVLVLCGQGGIGKTSLAVKLMAACGVDPLVSNLSDTCTYTNVLFCEVTESSSFDLAGELLAAFGLAANRDGATPTQIIDTILARLHQDRWLVIIDNLESLMEFDSAKAKSSEVGDLLYALADKGHNSKIVITSRKFPADLHARQARSFTPGIVCKRDIPGISEAASIQLLKDLGMQDREEDLQWIAARVKGNVLVLEQLSQYSDQPGQLRQEPELVTDEATPVVRAQWEKQGAAAQELLERMCVLRIEMNAADLTTLRLLQPDGEAMEFTKEAKKATEGLLKGLVNCGLVEKTYDKLVKESRYTLHRLIAETLQAIFENDLEHLWEYAARLYGSFDSSQEFLCLADWRWNLEKLHFLWLLEMCEDVSAIVIESLLSQLGQWGYWSLQKEWSERVLPYLQGIDRRNCLQILGTVCRNIGQWDDAEQFYQKSLELCIEIEDCSGIASSWAYLGYVSYLRGKRHEAEKLYQKSLETYTKTDNFAGMAKVYGLLANIARDQEMWKEATEFIQKCLDIETELDDRAGMAASWGFMGEIARMQGNWDEAEQLLLKDLDINIELGNRWQIVDAWGCLGANELDRGNLESAERWLTQALEGKEELQMLWGIAETNYNLARLYRAKGDEQQAQSCYSISHKIYTKIGANKDLGKIESEWL
jgi:tetratricopeptide (TPR) repeat protein